MSSTIFSPAVRIVAALAVILGIAVSAIAAEMPQSSAVAKPADGKPGLQAEKSSRQSQEIPKLIQQLGDKDYFVRQRAQDALARLGFDAFDALNAATTNDDLEIATRAKYLLRLMHIEWVHESDPPEVKRGLRDYEFQNTRAREGRMQFLAGLPNGQGLVALCRLVRFEKSLLLSKVAAVALLTSPMAAKNPSDATIELVRKNVSDCKRPGAMWLLAWSRIGGEPDAVMAELAKTIDDEMQLLDRSPNETTSAVVAGLTRFQIVHLKKLCKTEEATKAIQRLVELEHGNLETLAELLDWLMEQKAWNAVDELARRFAAQFAAEPGLRYSLAMAYAEQDRKDQAEKTAKEAFLLHPGKQQDALLRHLLVARHLQQQGQFAWARREYEYIAQVVGGEYDELRAMTQSLLAEMLHDQGQDLDAAETLKKLVQSLDSGKVNEAALGERKKNEVRARMEYFFACHWESKNDAAKHRESLDKALKAEPGDVDVLIACYRLPDQSTEYHTKIVDLIKKSATEARAEIAEEPESPTGYNQLAWLIGNTEGDFEEALRFSQKSLELKPNEGGFYDTLGRVYFAKGDLENAVKNQTKALELEPHSGLIRRQLEFFRKQQREKKT
jgi:tetratricopeptide (TPR) repeat protein